jgi:hypothetical protein
MMAALGCAARPSARCSSVRRSSAKASEQPAFSRLCRKSLQWLKGAHWQGWSGGKDLELLGE